MGGDEDDESLDKTLWMLEIQGIIPGTPVTKEGGVSCTTRPQDTTLEVGSMEVEWDGDDDEDYWLSQTLQVQESKDTSSIGVTSTPRPHDSKERGMKTLPAS